MWMMKQDKAKQEILVYGYRAYFTGRQEVAYEVSDFNGIFQEARITTAYATEEYRVMMHNVEAKFDGLCRLTPQQKQRYFEIGEQMQKLREESQRLLQEAAINGIPITFDWMKQHQRPNISIPEEFKSKKAITSLRRGSKVIIDTTLSSWHQWVGLVGKLRRFNPKYAEIELKDKRRIRVPYAYLKIYNQETKQHAKESKRHAEMGASIAGQMNKILS